ncbi:E3 ubiquitin-protein ligase RNF6 isoform X3 [Macaca nemestrina]|nr:PREDICTED: E3 ubiquitin-protein ligase RNF6 isoform X3 [Macaca fascicularis]XP_024651301.1 E3 ubiquitin-protein ligase RNF6 isoform X3 [Macaca nemestrina]
MRSAGWRLVGMHRLSPASLWESRSLREALLEARLGRDGQLSKKAQTIEGWIPWHMVKACRKENKKARNLRMNQSTSRSDGGSEESLSQDHNHHENERRWQQERLHREEAYYQFINELNDEDYRLMRDHNLLGTPGEITSEELQQRLDGVKEQLASQPDLRNGTNYRDSEVPRESSHEDSLLEWLNTFRRTGNATRSGQNGNQTWRAACVKNNSRRRRRIQQILNCCTTTSNNHTGPSSEKDPSWRK